MVKHQLDERKRVAELMCKENPDPINEVKYHRRILTINALLALCQKREPPRRQKPDRTLATKAEGDPPKPPSFPVTCARTQCIFCFWNRQESYDVRLRHFATVYKARDHVELHLKHYKPHDQISCTDPGCQKDAIVLDGHMDFKSHAAREHDYNIFNTRFP